MIEYIDLGSIFGTGGLIYYLLHKEIDSLKTCITHKYVENSKEISKIKGHLNIQ